MGYHVRDYHLALDRVTDAPLELTPRDFDVLLEFGGPQDEERARSAQRTAQLAIVTTAAGPLQTKTAAPRPSAPPRPAPATVPTWLAPAIAKVIRQVVGPLRDRVKVLEATCAQQAATITALQDSNKALGKLVTRDLDAPRPAPGLADLATSSSAKH